MAIFGVNVFTLVSLMQQQLPPTAAACAGFSILIAVYVSGMPTSFGGGGEVKFLPSPGESSSLLIIIYLSLWWLN